MGPPLKAAENFGSTRASWWVLENASMGPPLKAAENVDLIVMRISHATASMGPPLKAAENASVS